MKIVAIPASTSVSDANGNSKVTRNGVGGVLGGLVIAVTNALDSLVTISDLADGGSPVTVVPAVVTANGVVNVNFYGAQSRQSDWRVGTSAGVSVIAITEG